MLRWLRAWRVLLVFSVLTLLLSGCGESIKGDPSISALLPQGPVADSQLFLIMFSLAIMIIVFVVVMVIFVYVLVRYRQKPGQTGIPKQVEGSHVLEIIWTVVPIIFLIALAIPTVMTTFDLADQSEGAEDAIKVRVTAHQYWWEFEYPELGIASAQELVIPEDKWVYFELTATDVIHSFWVPALGGKVDTNPNQTTHLKLKADNAGLFRGKCAELCGPAHALMNFKVRVVEQAEYDKWVAGMTNFNAETATTEQGREIFAKNCIGCHAIDTSITSKSAPHLAGYPQRSELAGILPNDTEHLTQWIKDPQKLKPGNKMPGFGDQLSEQEIAALVEYVQSLRIE
jgi:cytochrome c oxidase subunit 2